MSTHVLGNVLTQTIEYERGKKDIKKAKQKMTTARLTRIFDK